jgi:nitrite reductase/ring-hydroxylating ferredoxin subunit
MVARRMVLEPDDARLRLAQPAEGQVEVGVELHRGEFGMPQPVVAGERLCALEDIPDPGARGFRFREGSALFAGFVVRKDGVVAGYVDRCPHAGWPLAALDERFLTRDGTKILCSGHGALFRPDDGACVTGPCAGQSLQSWPVTVRDGSVFTA